MKTNRIILLSTLLLIGSIAWAQSTSTPVSTPQAASATGQTTAPDKADDDGIKTLINGKAKHGGFGSLDFGYAEFSNVPVIMLGMRGAWTINHGFSIGVGGKGFLPDVQLSGILEGDDAVELYGGYGGLFIEPTLFPKSPIHITFPILIGAGYAAYESHNLIYNSDGLVESFYFYDEDVFFVAEPAAMLELNVVKFMRLAGGVSYRFIHQIDLPNTKSDAFDGFSGTVSLKFGSF